jgi:hypothetical protein
MGQLNPRSAVGQIEEASTSLRAVGPAIASQRQAAKTAWQGVVLKKALPPGMKDLPKGSLSDQLDAVYKGFEPAYAAVKGDLVYPAIHMGGNGIPLQTLGKNVGAFDRAVGDPAVLADDATRGMVKRLLDNQLSLLPQRKGAVGQVPVENLLKMRSNIRDAVRGAVRQQRYDAADLLGNAEDAVTQAIESQVSPKTSAALRAADQQYRVYKIVEDAVSRAGDSPSGFQPSHLTASLKAATDKGAFARGGGGVLRDLSRTGSSVFESVTPPTGARLLAVGPLGEWVTGPLTFTANRPMTPRSALPPASPIAQALARAMTAGGVSASTGD